MEMVDRVNFVFPPTTFKKAVEGFGLLAQSGLDTFISWRQRILYSVAQLLPKPLVLYVTARLVDEALEGLASVDPKVNPSELPIITAMNWWAKNRGR